MEDFGDKGGSQMMDHIKNAGVCKFLIEIIKFS